MATFTIQIEVGAADAIGPFHIGTVWQGLPSEVIDTEDMPDNAPPGLLDGLDAQGLADWIAGNQTLIDEGLWRINVWAGADADASTEPAGRTHSFDPHGDGS